MSENEKRLIEPSRSPDSKPTIKLVNDTGFVLGWIAGRIGYPGHSMSLVVKATFDMHHEGVVTQTEDPMDLCGDLHYDDDPEASLRYSSDFAYFKPYADLLLVGSAYVPGGQAAPACKATFKVGPYEHSVLVTGERRWRLGPGEKVLGYLDWKADSFTEQHNFSRMELRYENSFGGEGYQYNPVGKGYIGKADDLPEIVSLPTIENLEHPLKSLHDRPLPAGFGPVSSTWQQRMNFVGDYGGDWLKTRWPWFPDSFDWRYFNAAPQALHLGSYLAGDEYIECHLMHPEIQIYKTQLPGMRVRCFVNRVRGAGKDESIFQEVELKIDTLWVDMDIQKLVLLWRGVSNVSSEMCEDVSHVFIFLESMSQVPCSTDEAQVRFLKQLEGEPEEAVVDVDLDAEIVLFEQQVREEMIAAGLDPAELDAAPRPPKTLDEKRAALREQLIAAGADASIADTWTPQDDDEEKIIEEFLQETGMELPVDEDALTRESCIVRLQSGGDFTNVDLTGLDLSELDFSGANLEHAILDGSNLRGCTFKNATLYAASLTGANLSEADLTDANLAEADLCKATLRQACLVNANLQRALLEGAMLDGANLKGIKAGYSSWVNASMVEADLSGAILEFSDLTKAVLTQSKFTNANMQTTTMEGVSAERCIFDGANLSDANGSEGADFNNSSFVGVTAASSIWEYSQLTGVKFDGADLSNADFTASVLEGARFYRCNMPLVNFSKAFMKSTNLVQANLFRGSLEKVDLSSANLSGANLYEVELRDAVTETAVLEQTNLKMTKLA